MTTNSAAASFAGTTAAPAAPTSAAPVTPTPATPVGDITSLVPNGTQGTPLATPPAAPAANGEWYAELQDEGIRTWAQAKGWKGPLDVVQSAYNLEKLIGFDRAGRTVVIPKDDAPATEWTAFHEKMGVPKSAAEYKLPLPEQGGDEAFMKTASEWFLKHGIPAKAAQGVASEWNAYAAAAAQEQAQRQAEQADQEFARVTSEWGREADTKLELGRRAAAQFIPAASPQERAAIMQKIEAAVGTRTMLNMFASIGAGLGEHQVVDGGVPGGFSMTPAEAQAKILALKSDRDWTAKYLAGDKSALAEMERLHRVAFPELRS